MFPLVYCWLQCPRHHPTLEAVSRNLAAVHSTGSYRFVSLSSRILPIPEGHWPLSTETSGVIWFNVCSEAFQVEKRHPSTHTYLYLSIFFLSLHFEVALPFQACLNPYCQHPKTKLHKGAWGAHMYPHLCYPGKPQCCWRWVMTQLGSALRSGINHEGC